MGTVTPTTANTMLPMQSTLGVNPASVQNMTAVAQVADKVDRVLASISNQFGLTLPSSIDQFNKVVSSNTNWLPGGLNLSPGFGNTTSTMPSSADLAKQAAEQAFWGNSGTGTGSSSGSSGLGKNDAEFEKNTASFQMPLDKARSILMDKNFIGLTQIKQNGATKTGVTYKSIETLQSKLASKSNLTKAEKEALNLMNYLLLPETKMVLDNKDGDVSNQFFTLQDLAGVSAQFGSNLLTEMDVGKVLSDDAAAKQQAAQQAPPQPPQ